MHEVAAQERAEALALSKMTNAQALQYANKGAELRGRVAMRCALLMTP